MLRLCALRSADFKGRELFFTAGTCPSVCSVCAGSLVCVEGGSGQRLILGVILSLFPPYYFEAVCFVSERPETH